MKRKYLALLLAAVTAVTQISGATTFAMASDLIVEPEAVETVAEELVTQKLDEADAAVEEEESAGAVSAGDLTEMQDDTSGEEEFAEIEDADLDADWGDDTDDLQDLDADDGEKEPAEEGQADSYDVTALNLDSSDFLEAVELADTQEVEALNLSKDEEAAVQNEAEPAEKGKLKITADEAETAEYNQIESPGEKERYAYTLAISENSDSWYQFATAGEKRIYFDAHIYDSNGEEWGYWDGAQRTIYLESGTYTVIFNGSFHDDDEPVGSIQCTIREVANNIKSIEVTNLASTVIPLGLIDVKLTDSTGKGYDLYFQEANFGDQVKVTRLDKEENSDAYATETITLGGDNWRTSEGYQLDDRWLQTETGENQAQYRIWELTGDGAPKPGQYYQYFRCGDVTGHRTEQVTVISKADYLNPTNGYVTALTADKKDDSGEACGNTMGIPSCGYRVGYLDVEDESYYKITKDYKGDIYILDVNGDYTGKMLGWDEEETYLSLDKGRYYFYCKSDEAKDNATLTITSMTQPTSLKVISNKTEFIQYFDSNFAENLKVVVFYEDDDPDDEEEYHNFVNLYDNEYYDEKGNRVDWYLTDAKGQVIEDTWQAGPDEYTMNIVCGKQSVSYGITVYALENSGRYMGELKLNEEKNISPADDHWTYYKFVPSESGSYQFKKNEDHYAELLDTENQIFAIMRSKLANVYLNKGTTYYFGVCEDWNPNFTFDLEITKSDHTVESFSIEKPADTTLVQYISGDHIELLPGTKVTFTYSDKDAEGKNVTASYIIGQDIADKYGSRLLSRMCYQKDQEGFDWNNYSEDRGPVEVVFWYPGLTDDSGNEITQKVSISEVLTLEKAAAKNDELKVGKGSVTADYSTGGFDIFKLDLRGAANQNDDTTYLFNRSCTSGAKMMFFTDDGWKVDDQEIWDFPARYNLGAAVHYVCLTGTPYDADEKEMTSYTLQVTEAAKLIGMTVDARQDIQDCNYTFLRWGEHDSNYRAGAVLTVHYGSEENLEEHLKNCRGNSCESHEFGDDWEWMTENGIHICTDLLPITYGDGGWIDWSWDWEKEGLDWSSAEPDTYEMCFWADNICVGDDEEPIHASFPVKILSRADLTDEEDYLKVGTNQIKSPQDEMKYYLFRAENAGTYQFAKNGNGTMRIWNSQDEWMGEVNEKYCLSFYLAQDEFCIIGMTGGINGEEEGILTIAQLDAKVEKIDVQLANDRYIAPVDEWYLGILANAKVTFTYSTGESKTYTFAEDDCWEDEYGNTLSYYLPDQEFGVDCAPDGTYDIIFTCGQASQKSKITIIGLESAKEKTFNFEDGSMSATVDSEEWVNHIYQIEVPETGVYCLTREARYGNLFILTEDGKEIFNMDGYGKAQCSLEKGTYYLCTTWSVEVRENDEWKPAVKYDLAIARISKVSDMTVTEDNKELLTGIAIYNQLGNWKFTITHPAETEGGTPVTEELLLGQYCEHGCNVEISRLIQISEGDSIDVTERFCDDGKPLEAGTYQVTFVCRSDNEGEIKSGSYTITAVNPSEQENTELTTSSAGITESFDKTGVLTKLYKMEITDGQYVLFTRSKDSLLKIFDKDNKIFYNEEDYWNRQDIVWFEKGTYYVFLQCEMYGNAEEPDRIVLYAEQPQYLEFGDVTTIQVGENEILPYIVHIPYDGHFAVMTSEEVNISVKKIGSDEEWEEGRQDLSLTLDEGDYLIMVGPGRKESFNIWVKKDLLGVDVQWNRSFTYNGTAQVPEFTVTDDAGNRLVQGTDYKVLYFTEPYAGAEADPIEKEECVNAGTYYFQIVQAVDDYDGGKNLYIGYPESNDWRFEIISADLTKAVISAIADQKETGKPIEPNLTVKVNNKTLRKNQDYKVTFTNNQKVGTAAVKLTGMGNYAGALQTSFKITHQTGNWQTEKAATCTAAGREVRKCTVCGATVDSKTISAKGHTWSSYTVTKQPTAVAEGTERHTCKNNCGQSESRAVAKLTPTIKLTETKLTIQVNKTASLKSLVTNLAAGDAIASWKSSNTKIVTVDKNGKIKGVKAGKKADITVTLKSGLSAKLTVTVQKKAVATSKIQVEKTSITLKKGEKTTLTPIVTPITTKDKVTYKTSDKKVATVNSKGQVEAKKSGTATITITSGKKSVKVKVTVKAVQPTKITGIPTSKTLKKGKSLTLKPKLSPKGSEAVIKYSSSNKKIAAVNSKGKITAKKKGTAVITVTAGKVKVSCTITVR